MGDSASGYELGGVCLCEIVSVCVCALPQNICDEAAAAAAARRDPKPLLVLVLVLRLKLKLKLKLQQLPLAATD